MSIKTVPPVSSGLNTFDARFGVPRPYGFSSQLAVGAFESIATVTVGSGGAASMEFTNIPQTYQHLHIRMLGRSTASGADVAFYIRFNSDSGSNYSRHLIFSDGSGTAVASSASQTSAWLGYVTATSATASALSPSVIEILKYTSTSEYKGIRTLHGSDQNGYGVVGITSNLWLSTNSISSILLYPGSGNFVQYSTVALYGIKAP